MPDPTSTSPVTPPKLRPTVETSTPSRPIGSSSSATAPANFKDGSSQHRRRSSAASPIDIIPRSPAARRMSQSRTLQYNDSEEWMMDSVFEKSGMIMSVTVVAVVLFGTIYSLIYNTAQDTSTNQLLPSTTASYFARKSNPINQYLVKLSWFWTSLIYLLHLLFSPTSPPFPLLRHSTRIESRFSRLLAYIIATACWAGFTRWLFGAGLGDRIIQFSGGRCAIELPKIMGLDPETLKKALPGDTGEGIFTGPNQELYITVREGFCNLKNGRISLENTHPELWKFLSEQLWSLPITTEKISPDEWVVPNPRWHRGFDISGHIFLLTLSTLLLTRELTPSVRTYLQRRLAREMGDARGFGGFQRRSVWGKTVYHTVTAAGVGLIGIWLWMLLMTSVWFHTPQEKFSGLALGLAAYTLVHLLTPSNAKRRVSSRPISTKTIGDDENRVRRGQIVDDGVIMEEDEDEPILVNGRVKTE